MEPTSSLDYPQPVDTTRVWAEVDLDALGHNLREVRQRIGETRRILLVVKADAYGHGAVAIAHEALRHGAEAFGVGNSAEALELRRAGLRARILVLGTIVDAEVDLCLRHDIEIGLHATDRARALELAGERAKRRVRVHLNVDTGMGRLGVLPRRASAVLRAVRDAPQLQLAGIMTHLAATEVDDPGTKDQLRRFDRVVASAREEGLVPPEAWIHAANSTCIFSGEGLDYDAVRPGLAVFGVVPGMESEAAGLRPLLAWRTQVVFLKDVPTGTRVGYGGTWTAARPSRIATVPVGYNDGLAWSLGTRDSGTEALVRGRRVPLVGRVSMDYATLDVTDISGVEVGDVVTLLGADGGEQVTVQELAKKAGTIPHEITCRIGQRVGRVYRGGTGDPSAKTRVPVSAPLWSRTPQEATHR